MKKPLFKKRQTTKETIPSRITNETVAEHRERILAGGRRFKYPMQYARHRLVVTTIIITVVAFLLIILVGWWQLYPVQNTSTFFYRVTRVLPLPVATVADESVKYGDYLMYYNSSAHYLQQSEQVNLNSKEGERQNNHIKRKSMDIAIANTYAAKLARELDISVTSEQIDQVTDAARNTSTGRISQETYDASALSILGWSPAEYRQDIRSTLLLQEVSYQIDTQAKQQQEKATELLQADKDIDFDALAKKLGGTGEAKVTSAVSGLVPLSNQDGGLTTTAVTLEKGQVSSPIRTTAGDGYYFVKLLDKTPTQVSYAYIRIPLTEFNDRLATLKKENKIHEYINIPEEATVKK
ncbi:MAG TPA: peptidylprolyl isomerase [Candidatus Saccharimonadales bacterium]|nr:peptidylprolyl isomerase [Candidatus Saccharimonadales bacterium]